VRWQQLLDGPSDRNVRARVTLNPVQCHTTRLISDESCTVSRLPHGRSTPAHFTQWPCPWLCRRNIISPHGTRIYLYLHRLKQKRALVVGIQIISHHHHLYLPTAGIISITFTSNILFILFLLGWIELTAAGFLLYLFSNSHFLFYLFPFSQFPSLVSTGLGYCPARERLSSCTVPGIYQCVIMYIIVWRRQLLGGGKGK